MQRWIPAAVLAFVVLGLAGRPAVAQNIYPYQPPQYGPGYQTMLSPYLNMLRGGDPAANYFLGVLPEFQRRQNAAQFSTQISGLQAQIAPLLTPEEIIAAREKPKGLLPAGQIPYAFGYYGTYFNQVPGLVRPGAAAARPGQPGPAPVRR
jgi:hypothetical protein